MLYYNRIISAHIFGSVFYTVYFRNDPLASPQKTMLGAHS